MKKIMTVRANNSFVNIMDNEEWGEYVCKLFVNGEYMKECDYHTDDKDDAEQTAMAMLEG